ncbi:MAG: flagellar basal body P-ring formation chaperone FlgA [Pseudomonadota bacterium]
MSAVLLSLVYASELAADYRAQSLQSIQEAAQQHVRERHRTGGRVDTLVATIDPRLRMRACSKPLETFEANEGRGKARTVGVRCNGSHPWKLYVPVTVRELRPVVVAARPIERGATLTREALRIEERDVTRLHVAYISELASAIGKVVTRPVAAAAPILIGQLQAERVIRRGQQVSLLAQGPGVAVRMSGVALNDAALNERIQVRNSASERIVEGRVKSSDTVEIDL